MTVLEITETRNILEVNESSFQILVQETVNVLEVGLSSVTTNSGSSVTLSASNPVSAPSTVGQMWFNTTDGRLWYAKGTSTLADWRELPLGGSP